MKKKILLAALAVSIMSLSACNSETGSATNDTVVSGTEESKAEVTDSAEIAETSEIEETSEEAEEPQLEPVIALSYGDYEFDISNMTYKDLLAFFQEIGCPVQSTIIWTNGDERFIEDPYGEIHIDITIGSSDGNCDIRLHVYNPTDSSISIYNSKISYIEFEDNFNRWEILPPDDMEIFGIKPKEVIGLDDNEYDDILRQKLTEIGFNETESGGRYYKVLNDGRQVGIDSVSNYTIDITPVYDYGTY